MMNRKTQTVGRGTVMVGVVWASRIAPVLWSLYLKHAYFIIGFFFNIHKCACLPPGLNFQDWIMIVLSVSVVVVTVIALIFYR